MSPRRLAVLPFTALLAFAALPACGDDAPGADAAVVADAGPDAFNPCGAGNFPFTGEYVDWDSTEQDFLGIVGASVEVVGNPDLSASTAPNGRSTLCLPSGSGAVITFTQDDYLPARFTMVPTAATRGPYSMHGLTPARADTLFSPDELDAVRDTDAAQVLVEVRSYPSYEPVVGASVAVTNAEEHYVQDASGAWVVGDTLLEGGGAHVLAINVPIGQAVVADVEAPRECFGPGAIQVAAGELAFTTFGCDD
jgi:hypothetical protein